MLKCSHGKGSTVGLSSAQSPAIQFSSLSFFLVIKLPVESLLLLTLLSTSPSAIQLLLTLWIVSSSNPALELATEIVDSEGASDVMLQTSDICFCISQ